MAISSINSLLSNPIIYNNQLYRGVDRNKDNALARQEVDRFAADYKQSTGKEIDVDGIFRDYDVNLDGKLSGREYKNVLADDGIGMSKLYGPQVKDEQDAAPSEAAGTDISEWLDSLSGRTKNTLVQSTFRAETTGNFISAMFGSGSLFGMNRAINQYSSAKSYNSLQNLNAMFASFSMYL